MNEYALEFADGWDEYFDKMDKSVKERVWKKILQLKTLPPSRHLKQGFSYFISEIGQYRIAYKVDENRRIKMVYFAGDHKEYEKWLGI